MSGRLVIRPALVLLALAAFAAGCRQERYFGPYRLEVPTELEERSSGRTFHLPLDEQDLRIDYRLAHEGGQTTNASVWIGWEVPPDAEAPGLVPDLPRVDLLAVHLHRLQPGDRIDDRFTEEETRRADLAFSEDRFLVGASITENAEARISLEITLRVRQGG